MTWFADGSSCTYWNSKNEVLISIGWLSSEHDFPQGEISSSVRLLLEQSLMRNLLSTPWMLHFWGDHECEFCHKFSETTEILVPCMEELKLYVAPRMIFHYAEEHRYLPPQRFLKALEESLSLSDSELSTRLELCGMNVIRGQENPSPDDPFQSFS